MHSESARALKAHPAPHTQPDGHNLDTAELLAGFTIDHTRGYQKKKAPAKTGALHHEP